MIPIGANAENVVDFIAKLERKMDICRVYLQTQDWNPNDARVKEALAAHARGERVIVTMKVGSVANAINGSEDARQARILNGFKTAGLGDLVWGVLHEPEDNVQNGEFTAAQWRAMQAHMLPLANAILHPSGGQTISILMSWTANPSSGRNPQDYRIPEADIQGWDIYERAGQSVGTGVVWATKDPSSMSLDALWGPCLDLSRAWGKPTMVPEFGVLRRQSDTAGAERGAYFSRLAAWPRITEAKAIVYYEVGPPRYNYAFRTEQAGCDGFNAIGKAGGVITPPETDAQKIARLTTELATITALYNTTKTERDALNDQLVQAHTDLSTVAGERDAMQFRITKAVADLTS